MVEGPPLGFHEKISHVRDKTERTRDRRDRIHDKNDRLRVRRPYECASRSRKWSFFPKIEDPLLRSRDEESCKREERRVQAIGASHSMTKANLSEEPLRVPTLTLPVSPS
jgi:hypothetical protein